MLINCIAGIGIRKLDSLAMIAHCSFVHLFIRQSACSVKFLSHLFISTMNWMKTSGNRNYIGLITSDTSDPITMLKRNHLIDEPRSIAVSEKESDEWLRAVPSPNLGALLDSVYLRIAVALRHGTTVYRAHTCRWHQLSDEI